MKSIKQAADKKTAVYARLATDGGDAEWIAALYLRLSKEDRNKRDESNSIKNQRSLLLDFAEGQPGIRVAHVLADDGFTGANFDRDAFKEMIGYIEDGSVNCVIVKDFSRLGRDHIITLKYIERYFSAKKVRFISVNDNYDSLKSDMTDRNNSLIVPFRSIFNEATLEDISVKTRSQLAAKRKRGELVCNYTVYGYVKDEKGQRLVADDYAADVVRAIFDSKIGGQNEKQIADALNGMGVLSPSEYKKAAGSRYYTPFSVSDKPSWSPNAVKRILTNRVYTGCLEQGKRTKASYRMTKYYYKPREEWSVHEDSHEPVVSRWEFDLVQELMGMDTRITPDSGETSLFSGFVVCGYCGRPMVVKTTKKPSGAAYVNYICSTHKKYGTCRNNNVSVKAIEQFTLLSVRNQVAAMVDAGGIFGGAGLAELKSRKRAAIEAMIERGMETIRENSDLLVKSLVHFNDGVVTQDEFQIFKAAFNRQIADAENNIAALRSELNGLGDDRRGMEHIERFKELGNITELNRRAVATLIQSITVYGGKEFQITFRYAAAFGETAPAPQRAVV